MSQVAKSSHCGVVDSGRRSHIDPTRKIPPNRNALFNLPFRHVSIAINATASSDGTPKNQSGPKFAVNPPGNQAIAGGSRQSMVSRISRLWLAAFFRKYNAAPNKTEKTIRSPKGTIIKLIG